MNDIVLYTDCDGVYFNTIDVALEIMKELGCDMSSRQEIDYYFKYVIDWDVVFERAHEINNAFDDVRALKASGLFKDIKILTGLSGGYTEERRKRLIFGENLPGYQVITVQYGIPKALVIPNVRRSMLVDDEKRNCIKFEHYGGTAILFHPNKIDLENNIVTSMLDIPNTSGYKKLIKTR